MTYYTAFVMVGRVFAWFALCCLPIVCFIAMGECRDKAEIAGPLAWIGTISYVAVILCARYVQ